MDLSENRNLIDSVDARTKLAGSNRMEILLFSLGTGEIFGINVFKVREVTRAPKITRTPNVPEGVEGFNFHDFSLFLLVLLKTGVVAREIGVRQRLVAAEVDAQLFGCAVTLIAVLILERNHVALGVEYLDVQCE